MMASRGMGAVLPSKMPKAVKKARRDDTNFTQFEEGGDVQDKEKEDEIKYNAPKKEDEIKYNVQNPRLNIAKGLKELSSRLTAEKNLSPNTSLQAYLDAKIGNRGPGVNGLGVNLTHRFAEGGEVWSKPRPENLGKPKKMSPAKKAKAKAMAKSAGRPYPNLIDNMRAAKK
jgi:hypothetical protein